jgi:hypothetical protein
VNFSYPASCRREKILHKIFAVVTGFQGLSGNGRRNSVDLPKGEEGANPDPKT